MKAKFELISATLMLMCGCCIYLFFRSKSLNLYNWCSVMGFSDSIDSVRYIVQKWDIPFFIKFCLPDGLYSAAYILIIDAIWHKENGITKYLVISIIPIVGICSEILQYTGSVKGTFDSNDLFCYAIPPCIYTVVKVCHRKQL